jgi:serine/threonine protein kinase
MGTPPPDEQPTTSVPGNRRTPPTAEVDTLKPSNTGVPSPGSANVGNLPEQFGRYRIGKKLGEGSMGSVYLAHDTQLDRPVALKVPRIAPQDDPKVLERFHREARAAALFRHSNLCPVYDVGEYGGVHYLTMAYVDGAPLSVRMRQAPPFSPVQAAALVRQLALALAYAHEHGVVHRDLKPSNIMMTAGGDPVVMDFGLARRADGEAIRLTQTGDIMGTPAYMPPEQVTGDLGLIGPVSDVYSLGVILYELLTGNLPFPGTLAHILAQIIIQEPPPPLKVKPDLDPRLSAICMKAMAKKVENRYPNMQAFAAALEQWLMSVDPGSLRGSTTLTHVSAGRRPAPAPTPRRRSGALALLGILLLVGGIVVAGIYVVVSFLGTRESTISEDNNPAPRVDSPPVKVVAPVVPPHPAPPQPPADGFESLLSGKALAGWEGINEYWHVEDGMLIGKLPAKKIASNTFFCTKKPYHDFELRFQVRLKGGNSGLQIRSTVVDEERFNVHGPQVEIGHMGTNKYHWGSLITEPVGQPSVPAPMQLVNDVLRKDDFNDFYVKCLGKHITIKLNGATTVDEDFPSMADTGILALQLHHYFPEMEVAFRKFEIKELVKTDEQGYRSLFSGKDLSGWVVDSGDPEAWAVRDGDLYVNATPQARGWLLTREDFADFVLLFDYQLSGAANTGVAIRAAPGDGLPFWIAAKGGPKHLEVQLQDDSFPAYARQSILEQTGALFGLALDRAAKVKPIGEWNAAEITVRGRWATTVINGDTVLRTRLDDFAKQEKKILGLSRRAGRIGFQNHTGVARFRNIRIRELNEPAIALPADDRFTPMFNGRNFDGWYVDHGDARAWAVDGGMVVASGATDVDDRGWLLTRQDYDHFLLRLEFKLARGGNSGVTFRAAPGESRFVARDKYHPEIQIFDDADPAWSDKLQPAQTTGALYNLARNAAARLKPLGEWNTMEVMAWGRWLFVSVNGYPTLDVDLDDFKTQAESLPGLKRATGRIGLQNWQGTVQYRNVQVRRLPAP